MIVFMEPYQLTLHCSNFIFNKGSDKCTIWAEEAHLNLHNHLSVSGSSVGSNQQHLPHS